MADTVKPALVVPIPDVNTDRMHTFDANFKNWDFPVPLKVNKIESNTK